MEKYKLLKNGIFCLNKKENMTSSNCVEFVKKIIMRDLGWNKRFKIKVGHGGTLDYDASGVLVIGINHGCKILTHFLHGNKSYLVSGKFGEATDTYNKLGKVIHSSPYDHIIKDTFLCVLPNFEGNIMQIPPPYCALKINGKRMSDLIREGKTVHLSARPVYCSDIQCISFDLPHFTLLISCGAGFYVRSLVHDLGIALNSHAHVTKLCRIKQGSFILEDCLPMEHLNLEQILHGCYQAQSKCSANDAFGKPFRN
ncbi:unnamed protein product [Nezara viridula]|uniref:tRNA pseudouridine(55) synthase n=1 Tax=Nezara viridula TaxID=85310 RepID=A0A9P0MWC7_NEZVI|nr:unnamed protein product [Nezara viridula]